jgi:hypothetical protein
MARNEANDMMIVATPNKSKLAENSCCTESSSVARLSPLSSLSSNEVRLLSKLKIVDQHRARQYDANGDIINKQLCHFLTSAGQKTASFSPSKRSIFHLYTMIRAL